MSVTLAAAHISKGCGTRVSYIRDQLAPVLSSSAQGHSVALCARWSTPAVVPTYMSSVIR
jgi:hypothetical protein